MLIRLLTTAALCTLALGCEQDADEVAPPVEQGAISLQYISGHLGAYFDCPQDAMPARNAERRNPGAAPADADEAGAFAGDCAEDSDCGGFLNCQPAELRVRVTNDGENALDAVTVKQLQLDWGDAQTQNEVLGLYDDMGEAFDGQLAPGESIDLRIEYRGPHPSDVDWDQGLPAEVEMGQEGVDESLITPELQMVPQVAT
jgi:hypothetical protein